MGKSRKHHSTKGALPRKKIGRSTLAGKSAGWIDICAFLTMGAMEQAEKIRRGMAPSTISALSDEILKIPRHRLLSKLKLPARLVQRRTTAGRRLNPFESDLLARVILTNAHAGDILGDGALAAAWLLKPNVELWEKDPLSVLDTQVGYDRVGDILTRLANGISV